MMKIDDIYLNQVELLLEILPLLKEVENFALKGGTAINLFVQNMPRLSIDIDLAYIPIEVREKFLSNVNNEMLRLSNLIRDRGYKVQIIESSKKLIIYNNKTRIKVEPNLVLRGCVFPCEERNVCERVQKQFLKDFRVKVLSKSDLYGGKICAAIDRKHPRDLFDVYCLFQEGGITNNIRESFVVYLASTPRPIHELLWSKMDVIKFEKIYHDSFIGMTDVEISLEDLVDTYYSLTDYISENLTINEREFLISIQDGNPNWSLLQISGIDQLPGLNWKAMNANKMTDDKKKTTLYELRKALKM